MKRRAVLSLTAMATMAAVLAGCSGFSPVYGDLSATGVGSARFNFAEPQNRLDQVVLNRLKLAFPLPAGPEDPTLSVAATGSNAWAGVSNAFPASQPVGLSLSATVTITQADEVLFSATRTTNSTLQAGKLTPTVQFSIQGTYEVLAESTAESLRAAILAGYRPGQMPVTVSTPQN